MKASKSYHEDLIEDLRDIHTALGYLNTVLEEGDKKAFLLALRHVAEAQGGMTKLAQTAKMNRVNLYRMLAKRGNPELHTLDCILHALGFRLAVVKNQSSQLRRAA